MLCTMTYYSKIILFEGAICKISQHSVIWNYERCYSGQNKVTNNIADRWGQSKNRGSTADCQGW